MQKHCNYIIIDMTLSCSTPK